jgi:hypothetical protein
MSQRTFQSYPENAPGAFYVQKDLCIACRAPESVAPDLIGFFVDASGTNRISHCYFRKQPKTAEELDRAIKAMQVSCCGAYRYAGADLDVKEKLKLAGEDAAIDHD